MTYVYYSTQRPVDLGTYPVPRDNKVLEVKNFDKKTEIEKEDIAAYGYIRYEKPLIPAAARTYELVLATTEPENKKAVEEVATVDTAKETEENTTEKKELNLDNLPDQNIIQAALNKINGEDDGWHNKLKEHLISVLPHDLQLAKGILDPLKSFKTCNKYLYDWAHKQCDQITAKMNKGVVIEDDKVYSETIHYFTDVEEKPEPKPVEIHKKFAKKTEQTIASRPQLPKAKPLSKKEKQEAEFACSLF